jgi:hypothetical protein
MSYEGRIIKMCDNKHVRIVNANEKNNFLCPVCKTEMKNIGSIDDTNGLELSNTYLKEITPNVTEVCNLGHTHVIKEATYNIVLSNDYGKFCFDHLERVPEIPWNYNKATIGNDDII